jgi:hypothetical protein
MMSVQASAGTIDMPSLTRTLNPDPASSTRRNADPGCNQDMFACGRVGSGRVEAK